MFAPSRGVLPGLASPFYAGDAGMVADFERSQIHPIVGRLCSVFVSAVLPQMDKNGQRKRNHRDIAARTFMQGAVEAAMMLHDNKIPKNEQGEVDGSTIPGALVLFVGGAMVRQGSLDTVIHTAAVWDGKDKS